MVLQLGGPSTTVDQIQRGLQQDSKIDSHSQTLRH